jgi:hypothetical protein
MFNLLKTTGLVLFKYQKITDENSCRSFLRELIALVKPIAAKTTTQADDALLQCVEFIVNNDVMFSYAYRLLFDQFQTQEILFESADENTIAKMFESGTSNKADLPEGVNVVAIVSLMTKIISFINTLKTR